MFDLLYFSMWTDSGAGPARRLGKLKWSVDESCYDELVLAVSDRAAGKSNLGTDAPIEERVCRFREFTASHKASTQSQAGIDE